MQGNKKEDTKLMVALLSEARVADRLAGQCDLLVQSIQNWWVAFTSDYAVQSARLQCALCSNLQLASQYNGNWLQASCGCCIEIDQFLYQNSLISQFSKLIHRTYDSGCLSQGCKMENHWPIKFATGDSP